jgi:anti-anti-sigma factor
VFDDLSVKSNDAGYSISGVRKENVMATPLTLNTDRGIDGTPRVIAAGEIDRTNVAVLTEALGIASEGARRSITVDLSKVKYLDSSGINALFKHANEIDGLHLIVHPFIIRVLMISGLSEIATVQTAPAAARGEGEV